MVHNVQLKRSVTLTSINPSSISSTVPTLQASTRAFLGRGCGYLWMLWAVAPLTKSEEKSETHHYDINFRASQLAMLSHPEFQNKISQIHGCQRQKYHQIPLSAAKALLDGGFHGDTPWFDRVVVVLANSSITGQGYIYIYICL